MIKKMIEPVIETLATAVFVTDSGGRLKTYNSSFKQLLNFEPEPDIVRWYGDTTLYHPDETPMVPDENPVAQFLDKEGFKEDDSLVIAERPDGERLSLKIISSSLQNEEGKMMGAIHMLINVTDQHQEELKNMKASYNRQERLYEAIISSTPDLVYVFDRDYRFIFANDALLDMWGVSEDEYYGKGLRELGYEEWHAEMHEREIDQVIATKEPVQGEVSFPHAKFGKRIYDYIFVPVLNSDKEVEAVAGTTRDVTRRREAEGALRRNEEKYRTLVENFPNGAVALFDKDLQYTAIGGKLVESAGIDPKKRIGYTISDLYSDELIDELEPYFRSALGGEAMKFEFEHQDRHVLAQTLPVEGDNGEVIAGMFVVLDITEQWQAQRDLAKSEEKYRSLFEALNEGFAIIQMEFDENNEPVNFRFLETNPAYHRHSGLEENVEGKTAKEVFPDLGEDMLKRDGRVALTGEPFHDEIYVDEIDRWLDLSAFRIGEPEERKVAVLFTDITERKQAQQKLKKMNENLEERVDERTQSLLSYQDKLRSLAFQLTRTEEKQRHELATELHDNLGQLLALGKMKVNELRDDHPAKENTQAVDELNELLDDAIRYTRELTSDLNPPPSVSNDVRASLNWLSEKMAKHALTVTVEDEDEQPKPLDDEIRATVIKSVRELLFNVIKHTSEKKAAVLLRRVENQLQITVEDKGEGFDPDDKKLTSVKNGRFGLFNIQERIDLVGGKMSIDSRKGRGTKVIIDVPLTEDRSHKKGAKEAKEENRIAQIRPKQMKEQVKTKILLVDDHKMFRNGLRKIIEEEDDLLVVEEAKNGEEAVSLSRETSPDIILMDVNMPKMDGIEATRKIKTDTPNVRIIGVSLHDSPEIMKDMRGAGATAYLTKDEAFESLIETIRAEASAKKK